MENVLLNIIDEFLEVPEEGEEKESWRITDDLGADWALDKIRELQTERGRFEMVANAKIQQIQQTLLKEKNKADNDIEFFEGKLREYFQLVERLSKETKTQKSYKLPSGTLKLRKSKIDFDYDKTKLLEVAKDFEEMKEFIKLKEDFDWTGFKKLLKIDGQSIVNKETGELIEIEGLKLTEKPESFNVEV